MGTRFKTLLISSLVLGVSTLLCITLADQALRLLDYPDTLPNEVSHPQNFSETRKNVEYQYEFATNELGLRHQSIDAEKSDDVYRVLVVGDSFVEGMGVELIDTFTAVMERQFAGNVTGHAGRYEFINAGFSGQGPTEYAGIVNTFADKLDVDAVLLCLYANDLWDTKLPKRVSLPTRSLSALWPRIITQLRLLIRSRNRQESFEDNTADQTFVERVVDSARQQGVNEVQIKQWQAALPATLVAAVNRGELNGPLLSFGLTHPNFWSDSIAVDSPEAMRKLSIMQQTLRDIVIAVRDSDRQFALVYIPSVFQYDPASFEADRPWPLLGSNLDKKWLQEDVPIVRHLDTLSKELSVPFLDLTQALRQQVPESTEPLNFRYDEHLTSAGHAWVGQTIAQWLNSNDVLHADAKPATN